MRRVVVAHQGIPIGRIEAIRLTTGDIAIGELECMSAYEALRPIIREASRSLWSVGFLASGIDVSRLSVAPSDVRERAAELELELRDDTGVLIPTDFVNIVERPFVDMPPVVFARFRLASASERAAIPSQGRDQGRSL